MVNDSLPAGWTLRLAQQCGGLGIPPCLRLECQLSNLPKSNKQRGIGSYLPSVSLLPNGQVPVIQWVQYFASIEPLRSRESHRSVRREDEGFLL